MPKVIAKKAQSKASVKSHLLTVSLSGSGTQAYAYIVNDDFIKNLRTEDSDGDSDDSDDHYSIDLDSDLSNKAYIVCLGMSEDAEIDIKLDGQSIPYEGPVDEDSLEDWENYEPKDVLLYGGLDAMGSNFKIPDGTHLIIEIIEYDHGTLHTAMEISESSIFASELRLLARDVDTDAELSRATYGNGLLNEVERDVVQLSYKGMIADFDLDFSGMSSGGYYLVKRDSKGGWRDCEMIRQ
jgi:hypothetical protein